MANCVAPGNVYASYNTDKYCEMILPTDLSTLLLYGDTSVLDYINDEEYYYQVRVLLNDIEADGLRCVDVIDDSSFCDVHDAREFGILPCDCNTFVFEIDGVRSYERTGGK